MNIAYNIFEQFAVCVTATNDSRFPPTFSKEIQIIYHCC